MSDEGDVIITQTEIACPLCGKMVPIIKYIGRFSEFRCPEHLGFRVQQEYNKGNREFLLEINNKMTKIIFG